MKVFRFSSKKGKQIFNMRNKCVHYNLGELYNTYSVNKQNAYEWCKAQFEKDENSKDFRIGKVNNFMFIASWFTIMHDQECLRVETPKNTYIVLLNK